MGSLLAVANDLAPMLRDRAPETENVGRLPADLAAVLAGTGLMGMGVSETIGGAELHPTEMVAVIESIASANPSAGWCVMISSTTSLMSGWVAEPFRTEIFGDPRGIYAGAFAPTGVATLVDDDTYRLDGRWAWGSGSQNASWFSAGSLATTGEFRLCFVPSSEVTIIENWDVVGLRGTGSHDWSVEGAAVPVGRAVDLMAGRPVLDSPLYKLPVFGMLATMVAAVSLGIARAAVEELISLAGAKTPTLQSRKLADRPAVQAQVARSTTALDAARAYLIATLDGGMEVVADLVEAPLLLRADLRRAATHVAHTAAEVTTTMFTLAGGTSVRNESPLSRLLRDAHTVTQHIMVSPSTWEPCGKALLGLPVAALDL